MSRLWSRFCSSFAAVGHALKRGTGERFGPVGRGLFTQAGPGRAPARAVACRRRKPAGLFGYGARRRVAAAHMAQPGKAFEALFATCAGHAAERAPLEGKISMSEPLLGEAGPEGPEPALADGNRAHDVPGAARVWAEAGDQPQDGPSDQPIEASDQPIENEKGPKRRRRGSRGGRGRRGAAVALVDATDSPEGEGEVQPPAPAVEAESAPALAPVAAAGAAKPRIGDTRPGSPPAPPKRRARKETAPATPPSPGPCPPTVAPGPRSPTAPARARAMMPPGPAAPAGGGACRATSARLPTPPRSRPPRGPRRRGRGRHARRPVPGGRRARRGGRPSPPMLPVPTWRAGPNGGPPTSNAATVRWAVT